VYNQGEALERSVEWVYNSSTPNIQKYVREAKHEQNAMFVLFGSVQTGAQPFILDFLVLDV